MVVCPFSENLRNSRHSVDRKCVICPMMDRLSAFCLLGISIRSRVPLTEVPGNLSKIIWWKITECVCNDRWFTGEYHWVNGFFSGGNWWSQKLWSGWEKFWFVLSSKIWRPSEAVSHHHFINFSSCDHRSDAYIRLNGSQIGTLISQACSFFSVRAATGQDFPHQFQVEIGYLVNRKRQK